jgi:integrase
MAEVYKRKGSKYWWARITHPSGGRVLESTGTEERKDAQQYADKRQHEIWSQVKLGHKPKYGWIEAVSKWCDEKAHKKTLRDDIRKFRWLHQYFAGKALEDISRSYIMSIASIKVNEASKATANRYLALIRAVLRKAALEWEWLDKAPKVTLYPEPKRRVRWLEPSEVEALLGALPEHQADLMRFAVSTGVRQGNVLGLQWSQVDMVRQVAWIHADQAKSGKAIGIPLNRIAMAALTKQIGKHDTHVFTYRGQPLKQANTRAWQRALKRVGIENFRWHDLRHTWASWLVQNGVSLAELQELGGWESTEMVRRYAHLSPSNLSKAAACLDSSLEGMVDLHRGSKRIVH